MLNSKGIFASSGSACSSKSLSSSHVLRAIGLDHETARGTLRLTLGSETTEEDIDYALQILPQAVEKLREASSLNSKDN